jgi:hypothetical protein
MEKDMKFHVRESVARRTAIPISNAKSKSTYGLHDWSPRAKRSVRAGVPKPAIRYINDVGSKFTHPLIRKAPTLHNSGGEVFGDDVAYGDEFGQKLASTFGSGIEGDTEFADVVIVERTAQLNTASFINKRRYTPQQIPPTLSNRIFDPDDLRAECRERSRGPGPGQLPRQVTDSQTS